MLTAWTKENLTWVRYCYDLEGTKEASPIVTIEIIKLEDTLAFLPYLFNDPISDLIVAPFGLSEAQSVCDDLLKSLGHDI